MSSHHSNIPSKTLSPRASHRFRTRTSHDYDAYANGLMGGSEAGNQAAIDDVGIGPIVIDPTGSTPGYSTPTTSGDTTPPAAPTGLTLSSATGLDKDGRTVLTLIATVVQPTDLDLFGTYVEITAENDGNPDPALIVPIWTNPATILIGADVTAGSLPGVRGATQYWGRAYSVDRSGNPSTVTAVVTVTTGKDADAPDYPQSFVMAAGFKGFGAHWNASIASDLMFTELRFAVDDGTGTAPNTSLWQLVRVRTNTVWIDGLVNAQKYWAQARAVDFSGNVVTSTSDATPVDYLANPEAGWCGLLSATPSAILAADVAFNSVITQILAANAIDAATITTGILKVNTSDSVMADGIEVWNAGKRVAKWDETGLYIGTNAVGLPTDLSASDYVKVTDAGLTVYLAGVATSAITTSGINATAINFGALPGGHNLVQNSSFELADFAAAATTATWDVAADWTATQLTNVNATNGANSVTQTASTY